ncbi:MAG: single-stranded DNA-binding protein [Chloroflexi bacterium]|nr:single-stranded DNA-binding protein [Chloroflexota bacterium]
MAGLAKVIAIGNLGTDPEMRYTPQGTPVTSFRLAATRSYNAPDGTRQQETEWFTVVAWRGLAEQVNQYLSKGRRAYVEGRFHSRTWTGNDGQTRFVNEIVAERVLFLDRAPAASPEAGETVEGGGEESLAPDQLPF